MRSTRCSATTAGRVWYRDTCPPYVAAPTASGTYPEWRAQAVSTLAFFFSKTIFRLQIRWLFFFFFCPLQLWTTTSRTSCGAATTRTASSSSSSRTGASTITSIVTSGVIRNPMRTRSKRTTWTWRSLSGTRSWSCRGRRGTRRWPSTASRGRHTDWVLGFGNHLQRASRSAGPDSRIGSKTPPKPEASFTSTATLQDLDRDTREDSLSAADHRVYQVEMC